MTKNYIQLVHAADNNSVFMRIAAGNRVICVGADKNGKLEIFSPNHIPEQYNLNSKQNAITKCIPLTEAQTYTLLCTVEKHIEGKKGASIIGRVAERPDLRIMHGLMNAAGWTFNDGQVDKYKDGGANAIVDTIGKVIKNKTDKIIYSDNKVDKFIQQYNGFLTRTPANQQPTYTNLNQAAIERKVDALVDVAKVNKACDKQTNFWWRDSTEANCKPSSYHFATQELTNASQIHPNAQSTTNAVRH